MLQHSFVPNSLACLKIFVKHLKMLYNKATKSSYFDMETIPINYVAVLVAAVANMILGSLWFGPIFGKMWVKASGMTREKMEEAKKKGMAGSYALMFWVRLLWPTCWPTRSFLAMLTLEH